MCFAEVDLQDSRNGPFLVDGKNQQRHGSELPANLSLNARVVLSILYPQDFRLPFATCTEHCGDVSPGFDGSAPTAGTIDKLIRLQQGNRDSAGIGNSESTLYNQTQGTIEVELG